MIFGIMILSLLSGYVSALGCCFNPTDGLCTDRAEVSGCSSPGMIFSSSSCERVSSCEKVCCILGTGTRFVTPRECSLLSQSYGFEENYQTGIDEATCDTLSRGTETGACLFGDYPPFNCLIKTQAECTSGTFYSGKSCTDSGFNTYCNKTENTMCYKENLYSQDSCGNPDALIETCDYNNGMICEETSSTKAICKNLNCDGGKKNGESWCVDEFGEGGIGVNNFEAEEEGWGLRPPVGSRYFVQRCLNGNIETEPCADFREETCEASLDTTTGLNNARCESNNWYDCFSANLAEPDPITGSMVDEDACDPEYCEIWEPASADAVCYDVKYSDGSSEKACGDNAPEVGTKETYDDSYWGPATKTVKSVEESDAKGLIGDLHLELCVPKTKGGEEFWKSTKKESVCAIGTYETTIKFIQDKSGTYNFISLDESCDTYGSGGLIGESVVETTSPTEEESEEMEGVGGLSEADFGKCNTRDSDADNQPKFLAQGELLKTIENNLVEENEIYLNGEIVKELKQRCKAISDCAAEWNWARENLGSIDVWGNAFETIDPEAGIFKIKCRKKLVNGHYTWTCPFELECVPWEANSGASGCSKCGQDNLPCSEYRCKALGQACEYKEPEGIDTGVCVDGKDRASPVINLVSINPASPIPPYVPVEIKIRTDENSECKFNINNAGASFDEMEYEFEDKFGTEHSVKLTLPGQIEGLNEDLAEYPLITQDGRYDVFIRCLDALGNGQTMAAYPVTFEVMKTPDTIILPITAFIPESGSLVKYNTTEKKVILKMNEPMECRWSFENKNYDLMENSFSCTGLESESLDGYNCEGTLRNVTLEIGSLTTYYIRCKDQPWMINDSIQVNGVTYSRNVNSESYEYQLGPSEKLEITEASPSGNLKIAGLNASIELRARTAGGAFNGQSTCYWKTTNKSSLEGISFTIFANTGLDTHTQTLNNPYLALGDNLLEIKCNDSAGNEVRANSIFNLRIDQEVPFIDRIFYQNNLLKIYTDEEAICYYSLNKDRRCDYNLENGTMMTGFEKVHSINWNYDQTYYIKCKDYFGNYNIDNCGGVMRTY
jgi:hypothetical protein